MARQNSINKKSDSLTLDPGASGDSFLQFDINTTGEFRVGVDDTDDSFRISQGSALGTNDTFVMTDAGERTMPLQPAFFAKVSGSDLSDVTGDNTAYSIIFDSERFDQGSDYATGTGIFTAPITGRYLFVSLVSMASITGSHTKGSVTMATSNGGYYLINGSPANMADYLGTLRISGATFSDMDAADTAFVSVRIFNGTKVVDISKNDTIFSGCLIC